MRELAPPSLAAPTGGRERRENLTHLLRKHPELAVRLQEMCVPAIDPAAPAAEARVDTAVRCEHAARAPDGSPQPASGG
ncbi:hypothetical protein [Streptomyces celluloflavus]|uniref:hypothetical protein n=1 Tax=Streptomyces celluloflavus TaxID=58344 RepID=UPI00345F8BB8|nr:hypothetical protein OG717_32805 [Streptomyces celluloflavus]